MRKMEDRDGLRETVRRKNEEMEVKGQEEGGEGSSDPSQPQLLKYVCVCMLHFMVCVCVFCVCMCVHDCVSVCVLSPVYLVCGLYM